MMIKNWVDEYIQNFSDFPGGFSNLEDLLHWQWFAWNLLAVVLLTLLFSKSKKRSWRRLKAHLRSRRARSEAHLDVQFFILKILYQPLKIVFLTPIFIWISSVARWHGLGLTRYLTEAHAIVLHGVPAYAFKALWVLLFYDLAYYWSHRIQHQVNFFWHLHSVHHRSTYLTPLLKYRTHPFDNLINNAFSFTMGAFMMGVFNAFFSIQGSTPGYDFGYLAVAFGAHFIFGHIRHSHYWISYGPVLSRVLVSPAMHQIHHSYAPQHQGKNLGSMFAIWDLMFGTLYVPEKKEALQFGESAEAKHEKKTLWGEFKTPVVKAVESLPGFGAWVRAKEPRYGWRLVLCLTLVLMLASCALKVYAF
ncbi:hypothetical protein AZI86_16205 [Bdellovibrio bacteriovorus]|uniref:Fatty acid hydroxylase domain-containing protein n=1 Tax=Bdellovibrio bacteriovorus TaxID=959 RepID=A0A150WH43_BDEBC|nr:sterol desaturase family protein [Bdellovibrio bacteriovorus]KYG62379.1 hypothetical protein AZI86_16205 [Bdellovibrio bacteriovorus]